ncbi:hypothetical protein [Streptomyces sp. NPDC006638]|uniref:hypothetical protein n=1 Tax=Streptomyces sp. NPDC006638 TaxID=3157183 RepID=UPI0033AD4194
MTQRQRWAAAADMLASARNKMDGGTGMPADIAITRFETDISTACTAEAQLDIATAAVTIYRLDPTYAP